MEYKLINPSDPYTFVAKDFETAALTVLVLGKGGYGAEPKYGSEKVPTFLFGGCEEWFVKTFGRTLDEAFSARSKDITEALETFAFGSFNDRRRYEAALAAITDAEKKEKFIADWNDQRSSLCDIGGIAHRISQIINEQK